MRGILRTAHLGGVPTRSVEMRNDSPSWLCPCEFDRARLLENSQRVSRARAIASAAIGLCLIYVAPIYGWWLVALFAVSALNTQTLEWRMRRSVRPEYHVAVSILLSQALIATAAAFSGGSRSAILPLIAVPTAFAATRFRLAVAIAASGTAIALALVATLGLHPSETLEHPIGLIGAVALMIGISAAAQALNGAELEYRSTAVLDPLTGLLNRQGLPRRFDELAQQARLSGAPISLLICDVDHFKLINDSYGHATGDAVLRDLAYQLRKQLRSFELIYRIGGEEFLVLLPGATLHDAKAIGERICESTRQYDCDGVSVTLSVGAGSQSGAEVEFDSLFAAADEALYSAKIAGRDRVACSTKAELATRAPVAPARQPFPGLSLQRESRPSG
jgi:diguanylate cyclase (GGDEF)-like protein